MTPRLPADVSPQTARFSPRRHKHHSPWSGRLLVSTCYKGKRTPWIPVKFPGARTETRRRVKQTMNVWRRRNARSERLGARPPFSGVPSPNNGKRLCLQTAVFQNGVGRVGANQRRPVEAPTPPWAGADAAPHSQQMTAYIPFYPITIAFSADDSLWRSCGGSFI